VIGVFHLVRAANGVAPFRAFVESLRAARPRRDDWRLVLVCKGFASPADARPYVDELAGWPVGALHVSDAGFDIAAYFKAATATRADTLVFLNSFSRIVAPDWLELLVAPLARGDAGLVGATGSLESVVRNHVIYAREATRARDKAAKLAIAAGLLALFPPFPNPHVRTNAFAIGRDDFLASRTFPVERRLASLVYESGWLSLTRRIRARGKPTLVVDRDGRALPPEEWADARVFRSGAQDKVIVEDNRLREYADASEERKKMLRMLAFGK
jgi:hypothetical protein